MITTRRQILKFQASRDIFDQKVPQRWLYCKTVTSWCHHYELWMLLRRQSWVPLSIIIISIEIPMQNCPNLLSSSRTGTSSPLRTRKRSCTSSLLSKLMTRSKRSSSSKSWMKELLGWIIISRSLIQTLWVKFKRWNHSRPNRCNYYIKSLRNRNDLI